MILAKMQGSGERKGRVVTGGQMVYRASVRDLRA